MKVNTHLEINENLCGKVLKVEEDYALIRLKTTESMKADSMGLIHGGFVFGAADYAAMVAVNDPNVVLGSAEVRFLKPLKSGDSILAEAKVREKAGKKQIVEVVVSVEEEEIFKGSFTCFVLEKHVLEK